jgi:hypothetical protein
MGEVGKLFVASFFVGTLDPIIRLSHNLFICGCSSDVLPTFTVHFIYCQTFFVPDMIFELRVIFLC